MRSLRSGPGALECKPGRLRLACLVAPTGGRRRGCGVTAAFVDSSRDDDAAERRPRAAVHSSVSPNSFPKAAVQLERDQACFRKHYMQTSIL